MKKKIVLGIISTLLLMSMLTLIVNVALAQIIGVHDIAITDVTVSPSMVSAGGIVAIAVTVVNEGDFAEIFSVSVYYDDSIIATQTITDLAPGGEVTLTFFWDTTGVAEDVYTIKAEAEVVPDEIDIADNLFIDDHVTVTAPPPVVAATIDINPDTLNLRSKGQWITAYIELPEPHSVEDVYVVTVLLDTIPVAPDAPTAIGDHDEDGVPDLMVKFDRADVQAIIRANIQSDDPFVEVTLTITGKIYDWMQFEGSDTIRAIVDRPGGPYGTGL